MSERRSQWYNTINWQDEIIPLLEPTQTLHFKFLFHHDKSLYPSGTIPWFTHTWIKAKLDKSKDEKYLTQINCTTNDYEQMQILIQECPSVPLVQKQHNSTSEFSGLNGLIFMAEYFDPELSKRDYWNKVHEQLILMESHIPAFATLPLVLVYWPSRDLSNTEFEETISKMIPQIFQCRITKCKFLYLHISFENFDSVASTQNLVDGIVWLVNSAEFSKLEVDIFSGMND
jgi:hypothetical protein